MIEPEKVSVDSVFVPQNWPDFARKCKIRGPKGLQFFDPYHYQVKLVKTIHTNRMTVVTKTRQLGFTEAIANYFLWKACLIPGYLGVVFSKRGEDTSNIAKRVRRYIESLGISLRTDAVTDLELIGGGRIVFRNSSPDGARGLEAVWDILFDEAGFCKYIEEIYQAAQPTTTVIGKRARIVILSTPSGQAGWYWDRLSQANGDRDILEICEQIKSGQIDPVQTWVDEDGAAKFLCHWLAHPDFKLMKDDYLLDIKRTFKLTDAALQQEYNLSFEYGESIVFEPKLVRDAAIGSWEEPDENGYYIAGLDSSLLGDDYTVLSVWRYIEQTGGYTMVAMYRAHRKPHTLNLYYIGDLLRDYGVTTLTIETNSAGQIYLEALSAEFLNIDVQGVNTTVKSKKPMINKLILGLEAKLITFPSDRYIVNEFLSFRDIDGQLKAAKGSHDDIVMSSAITLAGVELNIDYGMIDDKNIKIKKASTKRDAIMDSLAPAQAADYFTIKVRLHSNYPHAAESTDATIKSLPGGGRLRRDEHNNVYFDNEGYGYIDCDDPGFLRFAIKKQGYVSWVEEGLEEIA